MAAVAFERERRGTALLLAHCAALDRLGKARESARRRLSAQVGDEFANLLVCSLSDAQRFPERARG
jgi:hypothetical protein